MLTTLIVLLSLGLALAQPFQVNKQGSGPFWVGTVIYIAIGAIACGISYWFGRNGKHSYASLSYTLIAITTFCLWIMWAMTWLSQWHPLVVPQAASDSE